METTIMMSCQDSSGCAWCHCSTDLGGGGGGDGAQDFLGLFGDGHSSSDDLFDLVWRGGAGGGGGMEGQQPSCVPLSSRRPVAAPAVVPVPERLAPPPAAPAPPSEAEMASWLVLIVCGEEFAGGGDAAVAAGRRRAWVDDGDDQMVPSPSGKESLDHKRQEMRKAPAGESSRRSHHGEAHNLTEKRRRHKINERLKTLQQLVPGCSKSNQASTLDQTIHYMKSLQHQVQAMSVGLAAPAVPYPVVRPQCVPPGTPVAMLFPAAPMVLGGHPPSTTMVPFGTTMLQLPHYPGAAVMMPAAAVAPMYPAAAPTSTAVASGEAMSVNRLHASSSRSSSKGRGIQGSSSLCQS